MILPPRPDDHGAKVILAIVGMCLLFGGSFVASKSALATFTPPQLLFLRFSLASVAFLAVAPFAGFRFPGWKGVFQLALLACLEPVLYFYLEAQGLRRTLASTASILISTIPLFVLALEAAWFRVKVTLAEVGLVLLSVAGIALLVTAGGAGPALGGGLTGNLLILGAAVSASFYTVLAKRFLQRYGALEVSAVQCAWTALFFLPAALGDTLAAPRPTVSPRAWMEVAFLGFGCSFIAYGLLNYALSRARAGFVAAFTNLIPVVSTGLAALLLGERLHTRQLSGAVLVLGGLMALSYLGMRSRRAAPLEG